MKNKMQKILKILCWPKSWNVHDFMNFWFELKEGADIVESE